MLYLALPKSEERYPNKLLELFYFLNKYPEVLGIHTSGTVINLSTDKISKRDDGNNYWWCNSNWNIYLALSYQTNQTHETRDVKYMRLEISNIYFDPLKFYWNNVSKTDSVWMVNFPVER